MPSSETPQQRWASALEEVGYPRLEKARFGEPCNGCGFCCFMTTCQVGEAFAGGVAGRPCPAMVFAKGRFWCGVMVKPTDYGLEPESAAFIAGMLGVGKGCCSDDFTEGDFEALGLAARRPGGEGGERHEG